MHKWMMRSKTIWFNVLALAGFVAAGQGDLLGEVNDLLGDGAGEAMAAAIVPVGNIITRFTTSQPMGAGGKSALRSKTMWWNIIMIGAGVVAFMSDQPTLGLIFIGLALVNMVLRGVTGTRLTVLPHRSAY